MLVRASVDNLMMGKFNSIFVCSQRNHMELVHYIHCGLCDNMYEHKENKWSSLIETIKEHLLSTHSLRTNNTTYEFVRKTEHILAFTGLDRVVVPNFISMFVQSNIIDLFTKFITDQRSDKSNEDRNFGERDYYDDDTPLLSFEGIEFTCTICDRQFDSVSEEVFTIHTVECIAANDTFHNIRI